MVKLFHKFFLFCENIIVSGKRYLAVYAKAKPYTYQGRAFAAYSFPFSAYFYYYCKYCFFHVFLSFFLLNIYLFFFQQVVYILFFLFLHQGWVPSILVNFFLGELYYFEHFLKKRYQNIITPIISLGFFYLYFLVCLAFILFCCGL